MSAPRVARPSAPGRRHLTWLHLLPRDSEFVPSERQIAGATALLLETGLARQGRSDGELLPGPAFARWLARPGHLPVAGQQRGEVRLEAGFMRCYPDPGPEGFDSDPPRTYAATCPACGAKLDFFRLAFPFPEPLSGACPGCHGPVQVAQLSWTPSLPVASAEVTFGDLEGRFSLLGSGVPDRLAELWAVEILEAHVTL